MRRRLVINWCDAHNSVKRAIEKDGADPAPVADAGKGWSYLTFCPLGTRPSELMFDVERLRALAQQNNFTLPHDVILQHNKVVVTAHSQDGRQSTQLLGLHGLLQAYCKLYADSQTNPRHSFYGKIGGIYDRPEKGRVLAIYAKGDDALLEINASLERLASQHAQNGCTFEVHLSNGLSALPRMLHGFDDGAYRASGADHYRITDPSKFHVLIDQALADYVRYQFE